MNPRESSFPRRDELAEIVERMAREALAYLAEVDALPVLSAARHKYGDAPRARLRRGSEARD